MHAKYEAILRALAQCDATVRDRALRPAAERWPGSLREAQLVAPPSYRRRHAMTAPSLAAVERPRSWWAEQGAASVVLWSDLHRMLKDQRDWRAQALAGRSSRVLVDPARTFVASLHPEARERWLGAETRPPGTAVVDARWARRILASRAGISPVALEHHLREGP